MAGWEKVLILLFSLWAAAMATHYAKKGDTATTVLHSVFWLGCIITINFNP